MGQFDLAGIALADAPPTVAGDLSFIPDIDLVPMVKDQLFPTRPGRDLIQCRSGTYANRPAAAPHNRSMIYRATDIGVSPGCPFISDGATWRQLMPHYFAVNTANVVISTTAETSIFSGAPSLPNGCLAIGTRFDYDASCFESGGGTATASVQFKQYLGATAVGTSAAWASGDGWSDVMAFMQGEFTVRTTGAGGTAMPAGIFTKQIVGGAYDIAQRLATTTATTVDTTGAISPNVKITLSAIVNSPVLTITNAKMIVMGLV